MPTLNGALSLPLFGEVFIKSPRLRGVNRGHPFRERKRETIKLSVDMNPAA